MLATVVEPPSKRQLELINKIWDELERLFGKEKAKTDLKIYIEDNDSRFKTVPRLAAKLEELRQLVEKRAKKRADPDPEYLLTDEPGDGPAPDMR